jgi:hypothetical protein
MAKHKKPQRGDEVYVYDEASGDWVNGIVNATTMHVGRTGAIIIAPGHSRAYSHFIADADYRKTWAWPKDINIESTSVLTDASVAAITDSVRSDIRAARDGGDADA